MYQDLCRTDFFLKFSDEESPLYEFSARDISSKMQFEIILTMEGITPETGNTIQVPPNISFSLLKRDTIFLEQNP